MKIEKLKTLKTLLAGEIILTGSTALAYHGLANMEDANDLDLLILSPSPTSIEVLDRLQKEMPSPKFKATSPVNYSFIYEGVKVDVWVVTSLEDKYPLVTSDGVKVASIASIVKAKTGYNRPKDWIQLMQLSKKIFDKSKFDTIIPTISTAGDDDYDEE